MPTDAPAKPGARPTDPTHRRTDDVEDPSTEDAALERATPPPATAASSRGGEHDGGGWFGFTQTNRLNRLRYRLYAPVYDVVARPLEGAREGTIRRLDLAPGDRVLVLGSGTGSDLAYLPPDVSATAVDLTPAMVRKTAARARDLDRDVDALVGDAQSVPFDDDAFDAVVLHLVLSVVPDPHAVAAEAARVLAPEGQVSILDKFVPEGERPSLPRRALNPLARVLFSDLTRELEPILRGTGLAVASEESYLRGLYTGAIATPAATGED